MEALWIIVGIVYIIYMLVKEKEISLKTIGYGVIVIVLMFFCGWLYHIAEISRNIFLQICSILLCLLPIAAIFILSFIHSKKGSTTTQFVKGNIEQDFIKNGYHIKSEDIELLYQDPTSPLNHGKTSVLLCYNWICKQRSQQLENLSEEELSNNLGISINLLPLEHDIPTGEAVLKRRLICVRHILKARGLNYRAFSDSLNDRYWNLILSNKDYLQCVEDYIKNYSDEHNSQTPLH